MNPKTFIFIGRSGCGKGTQAKLLEEYLHKNDPNTDVFYLETGEKFRELIKGTSLTSTLANEIYINATRQPDFLAIHIWSHIFNESIKDNQHVIIDGTPRSLGEIKILDTAVNFYKWDTPVFIHMDVSRQWSTIRLMERGRSDDINEEDIKKRLDWFDTDVAPAVEYAKDNDLYKYVHINGEQTIEEVHSEILKKIF
ncbi:hypothetical protein COB64_04170 [Candidatus Wolfebacteria bacterium]|nr:MAG: hypothetical protein COB64_04170 [Candidatus Wolfebacteria bacterium]